MTPEETPSGKREPSTEKKGRSGKRADTGRKKKRIKASRADVPRAKKEKRSHASPPETSPLDFDFRTEEPHARDAIFHGAASLKLPSGNNMRSMSQEDQHKCIEGVTESCEKLIQILDESVSVFSKNEDGLGVEEQLMSDMARLRNIPIARRYVEMTLWRRIKLFSRQRLAVAEELGYGSGKKKKSDGFLIHSSDDVDPTFVSYRNAYLKTVIERYQEDLDQIRERESLDAEQVHFLLQCLQSGADLFSNLKCIEDKELKKKRIKPHGKGN
ncbi:unnamed protein product [Agarophyton chilense]|eukprot:gb/GEZJ01004960.1/.p1 GENE.gb/GEZJ01004960.1/~~gb/GEZJ01004960.1/.p1  ORF type:complete len:271 (-),score=55.45 gb/GEZJ01004960.1/:498-1310(-)